MIKPPVSGFRLAVSAVTQEIGADGGIVCMNVNRAFTRECFNAHAWVSG